MQTFKFGGLPLTVPSDFLGMSEMQYPVSGTSPVGLINWGCCSLDEMPEARWSTIETSAGIYDATALANLDSIVTFSRQNGASIFFVAYSTPTFYADAVTAHPTYTDAVTAGPWGALGSMGYPTSLTALANFTTMIVNRYNKAGGAWYDANHVTLGKGIKYWGTWSEPGLGVTGNGNVTGSGGAGSGSWWGTTTQLIDLVQTQYAAVKAADATIVVTTPGWGGGMGTGTLITFFNTTGTVTNKTGIQSCDALAWDCYHDNPPGVLYGTYQSDILTAANGLPILKNYLASNGYNLPLYIAAFGVSDSGNDATILAWYTESPTFRYTWIARFFMYCAAMGVQFIHPWNWAETSNVSGNSGNWQGDTNGVQKAYNDFAAKVSGKTITSGKYTQQGAVTLNFSDATSWTV